MFNVSALISAAETTRF